MFKIGFFSFGPSTPSIPPTKNLNVTTYRNGDPITYASTIIEARNASAAEIGCYASVNFDPANDVLYGKLYNGYAINDSRNLAPIDYHIPTIDEWSVIKGTIADGGDLKEVGTTRWSAPNLGATDSYNFTATGSGRITGAFSTTMTFQDFGVLTNFPMYSNYLTSLTSTYLTQLDTNTTNFDFFLGSNALYAYTSVRCIANSTLQLNDQFGGGIITKLQNDNSDVQIVYNSNANDDTNLNNPNIFYASSDIWGATGVGTAANAFSVDDGQLNLDLILGSVSPSSTFNSLIGNPPINDTINWYVPARDELLGILNNTITVSGGILDLNISTTDVFWSSTEDANDADYYAFLISYDSRVNQWIATSEIKDTVAASYMLICNYTI